MVRLAAIGALLMGFASIAQIVTYRLTGADAYAEGQWPAAFSQIAGHRVAFALSGGTAAVSVLCLLPVALGFVFTTDEADRPYALLGCGFLLVGAILLIDAYAHYGNLFGTSMDYTRHLAPPDVIIEIGDSIGDQFEIMQYAGLATFGIGCLVLAPLVMHSSFYPKPMAWLCAAMGLSTFLFTRVPALEVATHLAWAFGFGLHWYLASSPAAMEEAPATVS